MGHNSLTEKEIKTLKEICRIYNESSLPKKKQVKNLVKYKQAFADREIKIIRFICEEYTSLEIAEKLDLSVRRIEKIRHEIFKKSKTTNSVALIKYAIRNNIYALKN